jgi:hypothetical protein
MNNVAIMYVLQSEQQMLRDTLDQEERHRSRQAAIDVESSGAHKLSHNTYVRSIRSLDDEIVKQLANVTIA